MIHNAMKMYLLLVMILPKYRRLWAEGQKLAREANSQTIEPIK